MTQHVRTATIEDVLSDLDRIVDITLDENSSLAIFAYVYRFITTKLMEGICVKRFEDNKRMERFGTELARMYIDAFWHFREQKPVSSPWKVAFKAGELEDPEIQPVIAQHLMLGMNAHINKDFGIAAVRIAPGEQVDSFKNDFKAFSRLLIEWGGEMVRRVNRISPLMFLLDWYGERDDEAIVTFSIRRACNFSWNLAHALAHAPEEERAYLIRRVEGQVTRIASVLAHPPDTLLTRLLILIQQFEEKDIREVVKGLRE